MPWEVKDKMSLREEFVRLSELGGLSMSELCRRFGVSRPTGYQLLTRYETEGPAGLKDRSRQPKHSPTRSAPEVEAVILQLKARYPAWGARKLYYHLKQFHEEYPLEHLPAKSTIHAILKRHDALGSPERMFDPATTRFVHDAPNQLWQMDFKGHIAMRNQERCHPLTMVDDHSRYAISLKACPNEQGATVQAHLIQVFRTYGLPQRINVDNGSPWGNASRTQYTRLGVWLMRLGIRLSYSRPYHPQTNGKIERFHRSLKRELLRYHEFWDLTDAQAHFDTYRQVYNERRPHEGIQDQVPAQRYQASVITYPESLPIIEYERGLVRRVRKDGFICIKTQRRFISQAFAGLPVCLQETPTEGCYDVWFCGQVVKTLDLNKG